MERQSVWSFPDKNEGLAHAAEIVSSPSRRRLQWDGIVLVLFVVGGASAMARAQDVVQDVPKRVVVFDIESPDVTGSEVAQLPDLIEQLVSKHSGYEVIPVGDLHRVLAAHYRKAPACATSDACRREVVRELHAQLIVSESLARSADRWVLSLALDAAEGTTAPKRTSESMKQLKSLPRNVELCLERLFEWSGTPKPETIATPSRSEPTPPPVATRAEPRAPTPLPPKAPKAQQDTRPVLALLSVTGRAGFASDDVATVESLLLSALEATGRFQVIGHSDIVTLLDLEAKKQAAGCNGDDTACMTAIAGALGAAYVAAGDLGLLGHTMVLSFQVIEVRTASALVHVRQTVQAKDDLVRATDAVAAQTVAAIFGGGATAATAAAGPKAELSASPPPVDLTPPAAKVGEASAALAAALAPARRAGASTGHTLGIVGTILGAVGLAVGTGLGVVAQQQTTAGRAGPSNVPIQSRVSGINSLVSGAVTGWVVGGALAVTGVGLLVAF